MVAHGQARPGSAPGWESWGQGPVDQAHQALVERVLAKVWAELGDFGQFMVLFGHFCLFGN